jgi:pimeloyl-ACP methyl ester carboxylesterase
LWALLRFARGFGLTGTATRAYLRAIETTEAMPLADVDGEINGARVKAPTLLVHDLDDRVIPIGHVEALLGVLPGARLLRTRGLGHRRLLADADVAREVSEFVAGAV